MHGDAVQVIDSLDVIKNVDVVTLVAYCLKSEQCQTDCS